MWRLMMKDINGIEIKIGQTVKTQQPSGGFLPPADSETGIVEFDEKLCKEGQLVIRYRKSNREFDQFILLNGKINEVILAECYYCDEPTKPTAMDLTDVICTKCWNKEMAKDWFTDILNAT